MEFPAALVVDGSKVILGAKDLAKLTVKAEVVNDEAKGPKISIMKYKNKTGVARRKGHRQQLTRQDHGYRLIRVGLESRTERNRHGT